MCTFITAVVPADVDVEALTPLFEPCRMWLQPSSGRGAWLLEPGEVSVQWGPTFCDCGTPLGRLKPGQPMPDPTEVGPTPKEVDRKRREGWSETRVRKWIVQKIRAEEERAIRKDQAGTPSLERWRRVLRTSVGTGRLRCLALSIESVESPDLDRSVKRIHRMGRLTDEELLRLEEGVLHIFVP